MIGYGRRVEWTPHSVSIEGMGVHHLHVKVLKNQREARKMARSIIRTRSRIREGVRLEEHWSK